MWLAPATTRTTTRLSSRCGRVRPALPVTAIRCPPARETTSLPQPPPPAGRCWTPNQSRSRLSERVSSGTDPLSPGQFMRSLNKGGTAETRVLERSWEVRYEIPNIRPAASHVFIRYYPVSQCWWSGRRSHAAGAVSSLSGGRREHYRAIHDLLDGGQRSGRDHRL